MKKKNLTLDAKRYTLTIGWLYPELMSTYGDRGNITVLQKRCEWRGITVTILPIDQNTTDYELRTTDLLFGGGAQDREQDIVMQHLRKQEKAIKKLIENDIPALFVCGSPQLMGTYYEPGEGQRIEGLGIFDMVSKHPGEGKERLIGNLVAEIQWENLKPTPTLPSQGGSHKNSPPDKGADEGARLLDKGGKLEGVIVGFENHGGRTYLGKNAKPFAKVIKGFGNNGEDGTEGVVYKNAIGCYLHGPLLPKNPQIADYLIAKALEVKYNKPIALEPLNDTIEQQAKYAIANRLGVEI